MCAFFHKIYYFSENYIDGSEFLTLTEDDMRSIVPPIGLARKIFRLQHKQVQMVLHVGGGLYFAFVHIDV